MRQRSEPTVPEPVHALLAAHNVPDLFAAGREALETLQVVANALGKGLLLRVGRAGHRAHDLVKTLTLVNVKGGKDLRVAAAGDGVPRRHVVTQQIAAFVVVVSKRAVVSVNVLVLVLVDKKVVIAVNAPHIGVLAVQDPEIALALRQRRVFARVALVGRFVRFRDKGFHKKCNDHIYHDVHYKTDSRNKKGIYDRPAGIAICIGIHFRNCVPVIHHCNVKHRDQPSGIGIEIIQAVERRQVFVILQKLYVDGSTPEHNSNKDKCVNDREKQHHRACQGGQNIGAPSHYVTEDWGEPQCPDHIDSSSEMKVIKHGPAFNQRFVPRGVLNNTIARNKCGEECHSIKEHVQSRDRSKIRNFQWIESNCQLQKTQQGNHRPKVAMRNIPKLLSSMDGFPRDINKVRSGNKHRNEFHTHCQWSRCACCSNRRIQCPTDFVAKHGIINRFLVCRIDDFQQCVHFQAVVMRADYL
mmetsp:Transcript_30732/g.72520  ORF Transcript_30732/g.72520 Transcript_30732/m.72520 type:complete len:469 (-) Transcript_30732:935-2341(-)